MIERDATAAPATTCAAPPATVAFDAQLRVVLLNHAAETLWSMPAVDVVGRPLDVLLGEGNGTALLHDVQLAKACGLPLVFTLATATHPRPLQVQVEVLDGANDDAPCYLLTADTADDGLAGQAKQHALLPALDQSNSAVILCDGEGRIVYANHGFCTRFGYALAEVIGQFPTRLLAGKNSEPSALDRIRQLHENAQTHRTDVLAYRRDGSPMWVATEVTPVPESDTAQGHSIVVLTDITSSKTNEILHTRVLDALVRDTPLSETMALICQELERVAPDIAVAINRLDNNHELRLLAAPGLPAALARSVEGMPLGQANAPCGIAAARGRASLMKDIASDAIPGTRRDLALAAGLQACWSNPIRSNAGQVLGTLAFYFRQTCDAPSPWHQQLAELSLHLCALALEREVHRARMHQLAFYDALTGLPNRMMFNARAEQSLASGESQSMAFLFIDLDRFKRINESQGHAAGDGLLRDLARRMSDVAGSQALVGRQVSDEFIVLMPHCSTEQAAALCHRLQDAIAAPLPVGQISVNSSASIGVAMYPNDGRDVESLLKHADLAMHRAKGLGGGGFHFFSADMNQIAQEQVAMEAALRGAMQRDGLQLHYQPQLCVRTGKLSGVEALLRWNHPQLGAVSPAKFVPLAEEAGLIDDLSHWVLRRACRDIVRWRENGAAIPRVSVNLSARNFDQADFPARLAQLLREHELTPDSLILEITEGVMLSPHPRVLENLDQIKAMGFGLSLDDFGTGYSSLSHLHRLPITELKLDRSFVSDIEHSESARALITSVLRIGENLSKQVVAEGVETEAQRQFLTEQGCDLLQGYLFSPGLPVPELEKWIERNCAA